MEDYTFGPAVHRDAGLSVCEAESLSAVFLVKSYECASVAEAEGVLREAFSQRRLLTPDTVRIADVRLSGDLTVHLVFEKLEEHVREAFLASDDRLAPLRAGISRYQFIRIVRTDGSSESWIAEDTETQREVIVTSTSCDSAVAASEALRFCFLQAKLQHPNIWRVTDLCLTRETTLRVHLVREAVSQSLPRLGETEAVAGLLQISAALLHAKLLRTPHGRLTARSVFRGRELVVGDFAGGSHDLFAEDVRALRTLAVEMLGDTPASEELRAVLETITDSPPPLEQVYVQLARMQRPDIPKSETVSDHPYACMGKQRIRSLIYSKRDWAVVNLKHLVLFGEFSRCAFVDTDSLVCCGLGGIHQVEKGHELRGSCRAWLDGSVEFLPLTGAGRGHAGIVVHESKALVFGGWNPQTGAWHIETHLRSCEQLNFATQPSWRALVDMHEPRSAFTPCIWQSLIFLCGGWTHAVEAFDPVTESMRLFATELPDTVGAALCCVVDGSLAVITCDHLTKYCRASEELVGWARAHSRIYPWTNTAPLLRGREVFFVQEIQLLTYEVDYL